MQTQTITPLPAAIVGLLVRAAVALPNAAASHPAGVPRNLVEEIEAVVRANTIDGAIYPEDALPEDWSRQVILRAEPTNTYEDDVHPSWAALRVTRAFLQDIRRLNGVLHANGLEEVRVPGGPDTWDLDAEIPLIIQELVVGRYGVHFMACPDDRHVDIETVQIAVPTFIDRVINAAPESITVMGRPPGEGQDLIEAWQEACSDAGELA